MTPFWNMLLWRFRLLQWHCCYSPRTCGCTWSTFAGTVGLAPAGTRVSELPDFLVTFLTASTITTTMRIWRSITQKLSWLIKCFAPIILKSTRPRLCNTHRQKQIQKIESCKLKMLKTPTIRNVILMFLETVFSNANTAHLWCFKMWSSLIIINYDCFITALSIKKHSWKFLTKTDPRSLVERTIMVVSDALLRLTSTMILLS